MFLEDQDKSYLFKMLHVLIKKFGTSDTEWFCAAETIINTFFDLKLRNSHEYCKIMLDHLLDKIYAPQKEGEARQVKQEVKEYHFA